VALAVDVASKSLPGHKGSKGPLRGPLLILPSL
jgi:hypothetical protein